MLSRRTSGILALAVVLLLALVNMMALRTSNRAPDDAYISLRYADNLAQGHGLRFNPGRERVEGFSSPLHVMTMAVMIKAGFAPRAVSQFSSLSAALLTILVAGVWGQRKIGLLWGTLAALALALSQGLSFWARSGMETTGFTLVILLAFIAALENRWRTMGVMAGLIGVLRPDGILYLGPLFMFAGLVQRRDQKPLRILVPALVLALAPMTAWFLFRVIYFHDVLPNTYYAKMDGTNLAQMQRGLRYAFSFIRLGENQSFLALIGIGAAFYMFRTRTTARNWLTVWPALGLGLVTCSLFFILTSGGDWMPQHRFFQPVLPLLILMTAGACRYLANVAPSTLGRTVSTTLLVLVFVSQPVRIFSHDLRHPTYPLDRPLGLVEPFDDYRICELFKLGLEMRKIAPPGATFALGPVGAFPYAWGGTVIDMAGLNDREIARLPVLNMGQGKMGHEKGNGQIILARKPDFILMRGFANPKVNETAPPEEKDFTFGPRRQIWEDESFHQDYEPFLVKIDQNVSYTIHRRIAGR